MGHDHPHTPAHPHTHGEPADAAATGAALDPALDIALPDAELRPFEVSRRRLLRNAGLLGAGVAAASAVPLASGEAAAAPRSGPAPRGGWHWLAGDHHMHTQYSPDAMYRVIDHVQHANAYGLDWMVITDHGSVQHAKIGVDKVNPDIRAARRAIRDTLVFQGLEWNIPAAEHGTVFVQPGPYEVDVLKAFENGYDGTVNGTGASTPANEQKALDGLDFLAGQVQRGRVGDALFLANHPARKGLDSPHEIRGWRDRQPDLAIGMEGAPGHQAAGLPAPGGPGSGRGYYDNAPSADSYAGYPLESYRTWGGFDWLTATVGGMWDSLLSEGKPWWITANSDSHSVYADTSMRGPGSDFATKGYYEDPVYAGPAILTNGDFWPGYYSRTHVGARAFTYRAVMAGLRAGRVWVDHGGLLHSLDVRVRVAGGGPEVGLGGVLTVRRGTRVRLVIDVVSAQRPNWSQFVPQLRKLDLVQGVVTGPASGADTQAAPRTRVVKTWDTGTLPRVRIAYDLGRVGDEGLYVRLRGSDGNRTAVGYRGAAVDPEGPAIDVVGDADPWRDLWFYTNPIWVLPS